MWCLASHGAIHAGLYFMRSESNTNLTGGQDMEPDERFMRKEVHMEMLWPRVMPLRKWDSRHECVLCLWWK